MAVSMLFFCGCETFKSTPVVSQSRTVYPVAGESGTVTVQKDMTFDDSIRRTYSVTIPRGLYKLEAQDADYRYYALSGFLKRSVYDGKHLVGTNSFCGGLMIARRADVSFPAGIYRSDGSLNRTMVWRLDSRFMDMKNSYWTESVLKQEEN
jgi:hypothetical protein